MDLFPAIDLLGGKVVRLKRGDYTQVTEYSTDPLAVAQSFAEAGAKWVHVVDLEGARSGRPAHLEIIRAIARGTPLNIQVGGGLRHEAAIAACLEAGARRVVLGTAALEDWTWFQSLLGQAGLANRLALGLDARQGRLAVAGWKRQTDLTAVEVAHRVSGLPLAAIVYTDIAMDGTMEGPNLEATRSLAQETRIPVIASGGVGTLDHLRSLRPLPIAGAIVGRALYEKAFTIQEALGAIG